MTSFGLNFDNSSAGGRPQFSWSLRRRQLYELCRRAYYFHYYAAAGGWDSFADENTRLIYRLKHLCSTEEWLHRILVEAVRTTFVRRRPQVRGNLVFMSALLRQECSRQFRLGWHDLESEKWRQDPKTLNLTELYYAATPACKARIFDYAKIRLEQLFLGFVNHPLTAVLSDLDSAVFRHFTVPLELAVGELTVWLAPALIWQDAEKLFVLDIVKPGVLLQQDADLTASLHRLLAEVRFRFPSETVESIFYVPGKVNQPPETVIPNPMPREAMLRIIADSSASMLERTRPDGGAAITDFPGWNMELNALCDSCRFRQLCRITNG